MFATTFIYFSGHQRMIAAGTIGGWSSFAANRHLRHELPMIGRAVKNMSFLKRANLVIARLRTKE